MNTQNTATKNLRTCVAFDNPGLAAEAADLARQLGLPVVSPEKTDDFDLIVLRTTRRLELRLLNDASLSGPVWVEFVAGPAGYRRRQSGREMLARAAGINKRRPVSVLDATGGMGRDAFLMAGYGCPVHVFEQNRIVAALLRDGLRRASEHPETQNTAARIRLTTGDSTLFLNTLAQQGGHIDVIYLDPMFPERVKTAKVKKELQVLQLLIGPDNNTDLLFAAALKAAGNRVVVKRPKSAPPLAGKSPSHSLIGKTIRFDVYMTIPSHPSLLPDRYPGGTRGKKQTGND